MVFLSNWGAGAMAVTYRARDTVLVALKIIDRYRARREAVGQLGTSTTCSAVSDLRSKKETLGAENSKQVEIHSPLYKRGGWRDSIQRSVRNASLRTRSLITSSDKEQI